jgi:hypothetical protein
MRLGALGGKDQYADSRKYATDISSTYGAAEATILGGDVTQAGGRVFQRLSGETLAGGSVQKATGILAGGGLTQAAVTGGQLANEAAPLLARADAMSQNLGTGNTYLRATEAFRARDNASQEINYQQMQRGIDRVKMAGEGTRGFGGQRNDIMGQMLDPAKAMEFARAGMGDAETAQALSIAKGSMGADFKDVDMIKRAGSAVQSGMMDSSGDYMQQAGALQSFSAAAGGGEDRLQQIMQAAITAGVNSSKHIRAMAQGVMSLSARNAATGIDTTVGATMSLAKGTKTLTDAGMRASMSERAALTTAQSLSNLSQDTSTSFGNVMEFQSLQKAFKGVSAVELTTAAQATPEEINTLRSQFQKAETAKKNGAKNADKLQADAEKAAALQGLGFVKSSADARKISDATSVANATNIMGIPGTGAYNSMMKNLGFDEHGERQGKAESKTWDAWYAKDKESASIFAGRAKKAGMSAQAAYADMAGMNAEEVEKYTKKLDAKDPSGVGGDFEKGLGSAAQIGAAKELAAAAKTLSDAGSNFNEFNVAVGKLVTAFDPNIMKDSAEKAATILGTAEEGLGGKIGELSGVIAELATNIRTFLTGGEFGKDPSPSKPKKELSLDGKFDRLAKKNDDYYDAPGGYLDRKRKEREEKKKKGKKPNGKK